MLQHITVVLVQSIHKGMPSSAMAIYMMEPTTSMPNDRQYHKTCQASQCTTSMLLCRSVKPIYKIQLDFAMLCCCFVCCTCRAGRVVMLNHWL